MLAFHIEFSLDANSLDGTSSTLPPKIYDRVFALAYLSNLTLMISVSLLFRYADFVKHFGGSEFDLGMIIGISTVGAIVARFVQGLAIDRFGARLIWTSSVSLYLVSLLWHLRIDDVQGVEVYLARLLMSMSLAGSFGSSITFVSLRAPNARSAEVIGVLGSSGFLGMGIGPQLGDWIFAKSETLDPSVSTGNSIYWMFLLAAIFIVVSAVSAFLSGLFAGKTRRQKSLNVFRSLVKHQPGVLLAVAAAMGIGISMPMIFLRPYCEHLGIGQIGLFFIAYNIVAFSLRILLRKIPDRIGHRYAILVGIGFLALSMPCYLLVNHWTMLFVPAVVAGISHSFLFPSVVASCGLRFPVEHRGIATNLILACFDFGVFVGAPIVGTIIEYSSNHGLPKYPVGFLFVASVLVICGVLFLLFDNQKVSSKKQPGNLSEQS